MYLDFMRNINIEQINDTYYVVKATTRRFGKNEIMFEGVTYQECSDYVRRNNTILTIKEGTENYYLIKHTFDGHYWISEYDINKGTHSAFTRKSIKWIKSFLSNNIKEGILV